MNDYYKQQLTVAHYMSLSVLIDPLFYLPRNHLAHHFLSTEQL